MLCLWVTAYIGVGKQSFKHENGLVCALNNASSEVACFEKA
jgi:hypothetical protein